MPEAGVLYLYQREGFLSNNSTPAIKILVLLFVGLCVCVCVSVCVCVCVVLGIKSRPPGCIYTRQVLYH
jgi:hypothetical protein